MTTTLETIPTEQLALTTGGAGMGNIDFGSVINTIGGLVSSFDKSGKASQIFGMIGPLIQQFTGGGQAGQQQQQAPQDGGQQQEQA